MALATLTQTYRIVEQETSIQRTRVKIPWDSPVDNMPSSKVINLSEAQKYLFAAVNMPQYAHRSPSFRSKDALRLIKEDILEKKKEQVEGLFVVCSALGSFGHFVVIQTITPGVNKESSERCGETP